MLMNYHANGVTNGLGLGLAFRWPISIVMCDPFFVACCISYC